MLKELAVKAHQASAMAEEDTLELYKKLCVENPIGAIAVLQTLELLRKATNQLAQIEKLVKE